jgi:hypothetical protein
MATKRQNARPDLAVKSPLLALSGRPMPVVSMSAFEGKADILGCYLKADFRLLARDDRFMEAIRTAPG